MKVSYNNYVMNYELVPMKSIFNTLGALLIILFPACNNEIFLDDNQLPDISEVNIEGDSGSWSTPISRQGLSRVYINFDYLDKKYVEYRNTDYKEADENCPASELLDITYRTPLREYGISLHGDMLYFSSCYNASSALTVTLHLEYVYGDEKRIDFNISKGKPLKFVMQDYGNDMKIKEYMSNQTYSTVFSNHLSESYPLDIYPYYMNNCFEEVTTDEEWANGLSFDIDIPVCIKGHWLGLSQKNLTIGDRIDFCSPDSISESFTVDVPTLKFAKVRYKYLYSEATMESVLIFDNTVDDSRVKLPITCKAVYPIDYDYEVIFEDI